MLEQVGKKIFQRHLVPQPAPAPRCQATPALGQVPFCDCLGACDCAGINYLRRLDLMRRYMFGLVWFSLWFMSSLGTLSLCKKKSVAQPDSVAHSISKFIPKLPDVVWVT